jgi:hypothetical protein
MVRTEFFNFRGLVINDSAFCVQCIYGFHAIVSVKRGLFLLNSINKLIFVMQPGCVSFEVITDMLD